MTRFLAIALVCAAFGVLSEGLGEAAETLVLVVVFW